MYGFGYDELHDDYKVMVICNNLSHDGSHFIEVNIYSLKSDSWRITCEDWSGVLPTRWGTLVNGKLHWTTPATRVGVYNLKDDIKIGSINTRAKGPDYQNTIVYIWKHINTHNRNSKRTRLPNLQQGNFGKESIKEIRMLITWSD
ncbi:hypothetical protein RND71_022952 [Anisodus tanguticus]|uniref:F-box associated beta-propeller type 1 domain-containing protein n=1 Tax=Anisodus tanguticus TaxID=243964 RepID=A0AAE1RTW0_9SOLA|nr:hypothetical protein RND71_022952 [Anisodus tanguticus]